MVESSIEAGMRRKVLKRGGLFYKFVSPGNDGVPDRILVHQGRVVFVEMKQPSGKLSRMQKFQIERLQRNGADVRVVYNSEQADALIEEVMG